MRTIVITTPRAFPDEARRITQMLASGMVDRIHIRKPEFTETQLGSLLDDIPSELYPKLSLHDHLHLAVRYNLGGVHLNRRNPSVPDGFRGLVSRSCHSLEEVGQNTGAVNYCFLSPLFDSLSKPGYRAAIPFDQAAKFLSSHKGESPEVFALSGVTPGNIHLLSHLGFDGGAILGSAWETPADRFIRRLRQANAFPLQFITNGNSPDAILESAEAVLKGGARWIQLRMKESTEEEIRPTAIRLRRLCDRYDAVMILDDHPRLALETGADGVHLGKNDMPLTDARKILGSDLIIGATANTADDIIAAASSGADYIGLGPFRFTTTKKNLSPILGLEGYRDIISRCRREGITLPVVTIGGILREDIGGILRAGADGIAVSGSLLNAPSTENETSRWVNDIVASYQVAADSAPVHGITIS